MNTTVRMLSASVVIGLLAATTLVTAAVEEYDAGLGPEITQQPVDEIVAVGGYAQFSVRATGDGQLSYQWTFNGADLEGAIRRAIQVFAVV